MNEMTDSEKLAVLTTAIKAELERMCESQEPGITDLRYRLENCLLKCGIAPYTPYPIQVFNTIVLEDDAGREAAADEEFYSRYGM